MELVPRILGRKDLKAIKKNHNVDIHKLMLTVFQSFDKGEGGEEAEINSLDIMKHITPEINDAVLDHTFPNNQSKLDEMSYSELVGLTVQVLGLTFGGAVEKE